MIRIDTLTVGMFQSNCFVVSCTETAKAVLVDCGDEGERILDTVESMGVSVTAIINTHAHLDHVAGLPEVIADLGVPVWMHRDDVPLYEGLDGQAAMFGLTAPPRVAIDRYIEDGETFAVGNASGRFIHAPGHSPGSVCLYFAGERPPQLICGDVLFMGSIGRTDLPGGDYGTIMRTLEERFLPLPDDTVVYPGHGPTTTIGDEKRSNPFVAPLARRSGR
jgi:glyoxylase-like metal-dependent hydrolase (beta-lactamase superfamily II)